MIDWYKVDRRRIERTVNAEDVGTLEARMLSSSTDRIEVSYLELEGRFLATLLEESGADKPEGTMRPVLRASGRTIVEAVLQLELAHRVVGESDSYGM